MNWPVYVINMAANTTRMDHAATELNRLNIPFQRFEAVNGRELSEEELAKVYDAKANLKRSRHPMIGPEIGCYLSHLEIWKEIANSTKEGAVILEDDFTTADDLAQVLEAVAIDDGDWEILKLFSARDGQKLIHKRNLCKGRSIAKPYKVPNTTLGYAIRRSTAKRLAETVLPVSRPIDEDHKHFWEQNLRVSLVSPCPLAFGEDSTDTGSITAARSRRIRQSNQGKLARAKRTLKFRLNYLINLHWNRLVRKHL